jgi:carboxylesterase
MAAPVVPGAEAFSFEGGPIGILMLHGFTGNPASLRRIGEWLAARGHSVECPRYPGHGTTWKELGTTTWGEWVGEAERAIRELSERSHGMVLFGLSFGGAVALHLTARHPDLVRGLVLVNPYVRDRRLAAAPYLRYARRSVKGIGNDIKKPGEDELPYDRIPVAALAQVARFQRLVRSELPSVRAPLLVFRSPLGHVVPDGNAEYVMRSVGSADKELVNLKNSYHVATLDYDAELIFERAHEFAEAKVPAHGL